MRCDSHLKIAGRLPVGTFPETRVGEKKTHPVGCGLGTSQRVVFLPLSLLVTGSPQGC